MNKRPNRVDNINKYPYVCCEIGGRYAVKLSQTGVCEADEIAAMSLVRLGCGSNMQGLLYVPWRV